MPKFRRIETSFASQCWRHALLHRSAAARSATLRRLASLAACLVAASAIAAAAGTAGQQASAADPAPLHLYGRFHSQWLSADRAVTVLLPPGYDTHPKQRYPVLYINDGQNVFDDRDLTPFHKGTWQLDTTSRSLITDGEIHPIIVVAIDNTPVRADEYTPAADPTYKVGGRAEAYGKMLTQELKPFIDRRYRTVPGAQYTAIAGSSLGALAALYVGLRYPETFGKIAALSPSVWWANNDILSRIDALPGKPSGQQIYVSIGTSEGNEAEKMLTDARSLRDRLTAKGWTPGKDLLYEEEEGGHHEEAAWARHVPNFLRFFFPAGTAASSARGLPGDALPKE